MLAGTLPSKTIDGIDSTNKLSIISYKPSLVQTQNLFQNQAQI